MRIFLLMAIAFCLSGSEAVGGRGTPSLANYTLDYCRPTNPALQGQLEAIDAKLRGQYGLTEEQAAVGVLDLKRLRLTMVNPGSITWGRC